VGFWVKNEAWWVGLWGLGKIDKKKTFETVRKRLKIFENVRKYSKIFEKLSEMCKNLQKFVHSD
jgi:hypothetical protein